MESRLGGAAMGRQQLLAAALAAEQEGRAAEAEANCRALLARNSADIEAALLYAKVALRTRRADLAEALIRGVLDRDPNCVEALLRLARLRRACWEHAEAVQLCRRAIELDLSNAEAHFVLGICLADQWHNESAIEELTEAVKLRPDYAFAHDRLGYVLSRIGRNAEAISSYERAIECDPGRPNSYINLGTVLEAAGSFEKAEAAFARATQLASGSAPDLAELGRAFIAAGKHPEGLAAFRLALELDPRAIHLWERLGGILVSQGEFDEAAAAFREVIALTPNDVRGYNGLIYSKKISERERSMVEALESMTNGASRSPTERSLAHYALGKAYDDLGDYARAMRHFDDANRLSRLEKVQAFDQRHYSASIDQLIAAYTPEFFEKCRPFANRSDRPIFILGTIRSGTTLVEQILSSHPEVDAAGELTYLSTHALPKLVWQAEPEGAQISNLAEGYLLHLRAVAPSALRATDKMPNNYLLAGLIHAAFPEARIIHCRRQALDNCLSIYMTQTNAEYADSPEHIMFHYRECHRLMAHWQRVLPPSRYLELDYEELVRHPEARIRQLVEFVGLAWDPAVLRHQDNKRSIHTPSRWQAKQPIYESSVGRWRNYEPWLGAFKELFSDPTDSPKLTLE